MLKKGDTRKEGGSFSQNNPFESLRRRNQRSGVKSTPILMNGVDVSKNALWHSLWHRLDTRARRG